MDPKRVIQMWSHIFRIFISYNSTSVFSNEVFINNEPG